MCTKLLRTGVRAALKKRPRHLVEWNLILIRKADAARNRQLFITHALRQLVAEDEFQDILTAEGLETMPKNVAARISKGEVA